jgi:anti-sigma regulatory factor (Ser/Thr protein kinase)
VSPVLLGDVALVVSELVANSVRHAEVGPAGFIRVDLRVLGGEVWIAVGDRGSPQLPRIVTGEQVGVGGLGLRVVDRLARSWGVARDGVGRTLVWCRLALEGSDETGWRLPRRHSSLPVALCGAHGSSASIRVARAGEHRA